MITTVDIRTRVALFHDLAISCTGLTAACAKAGLRVEEPENLREWALCRDTAAIVALDCQEGWATLKTVRRLDADITILGLLPSRDASSYCAALGAGATVVTHAGSSPEQVVSTLVAALEGRIILPAEVVSALVDQIRTRHADRAAVLNPFDLDLLRLLTKGETVTAMAQRLHMAPRTVDRRLRNLYQRMGVHTRLQAVAWAVHWRVLDPWT